MWCVLDITDSGYSSLNCWLIAAYICIADNLFVLNHGTFSLDGGLGRITLHPGLPYQLENYQTEYTRLSEYWLVQIVASLWEMCAPTWHKQIAMRTCSPRWGSVCRPDVQHCCDWPGQLPGQYCGHQWRWGWGLQKHTTAHPADTLHGSSYTSTVRINAVLVITNYVLYIIAPYYYHILLPYHHTNKPPIPSLS